MKKNNDKKQHKSELKDRINQAAIFLFARQGFAGTGIRELTTQADVNLSMVSYYFGSKKGLLKEILDSFFAGYVAIAGKELIGDDDLHIKIERFITSAVSYFEAERNSLIIALSELPRDDPEIVEYKLFWGKQMVEIVNREICLPLAAKSGQHIQPTILSPMLTFLMASRFFIAPVVKKMDEGSAEIVSIEVYTKTIIRMVLQGITGPDNEAM